MKLAVIRAGNEKFPEAWKIHKINGRCFDYWRVNFNGLAVLEK